MDNQNCMALVPYVPVKKKVSYFSELFLRRRLTYFVLLPLAVASAVAGAYYCLFYAENGVLIPFAGRLLSVSSLGWASSLAAFFSLMLSYTVFSSAGSIMLLAPLSFGAGFAVAKRFAACGFSAEFVLFSAVQALFIFTAIIYCCELCMRLTVTRQGFKYVISKRNNLPLIIKTLIFYLAFICNSLYIDNLNILKGCM